MRHVYYISLVSQLYMEKKVIKYDGVNVSNILFDAPFVTSNKKYIVSNIWYNKSCPHTFNIQTSRMDLHEINFSENKLIATPCNQLANILDELDESACDFIKCNKLAKQYSISQYSTIVKNMNSSNTLPIIQINISTNDKPTLFFSATNKKQIPYNSSMWTHVNELKIILTINSLVIDIAKKTAYISFEAKHILLYKLTPMKIELADYSFIESENDNNNNDDDNNHDYDNNHNYDMHCDDNNSVHNSDIQDDVHNSIHNNDDERHCSDNNGGHNSDNNGGHNSDSDNNNKDDVHNGVDNSVDNHVVNHDRTYNASNYVANKESKSDSDSDLSSCSDSDVKKKSPDVIIQKPLPKQKRAYNKKSK